MAKNFWTSKEGKKATQQAAITDMAGSMRVSPGTRQSHAVLSTH